ncbi:MAG TPA: PilW family protein [Thermodesulfobacteriota bacterium]
MARQGRHEKGLTLVELMMAIALSLVIGAVGYVFYATTVTFAATQGRAAAMQADIRVAADMLSRDIRNAGFGILDPFAREVIGATPPVAPANNVDSGVDGIGQTDRITLRGGYVIAGALIADATQGATTIRLTPQAGIDPQTLNGQTITIEGFYTGTAGAWTSATNTLAISPGLTRDFNAGDAVVIVRTVSWSVAVPTGETEPALFRDDGGGAGPQIVARGVEDLQFAYLLANGTEANGPVLPALPAWPTVRAVRFTIVARRPEARADQRAVSIRPAVEDRGAGAAADAYRRRIITKVVEVRNLGG